MRCLITGAAGFIGSHLAERLLAQGHEVVGVDCLTPYYAPAIKERNLTSLRDHAAFRFIQADLAEADLAPIAGGMDWVFHLAGQPGVRSSWGPSFAEYARHNITATQRLLEALRDAPPRRLIYASSSSVYGGAALPMAEEARPQPLSPYGVTKLAAEHLTLAYGASFGIPVTALRFFTVYGPRQRPDMAINRFIHALLRNEPLHIYGDGTQTRDMTYVEDVVAACLAATALEGAHVINVGGGCSVSINDIVAFLASVLCVPSRSIYEDRQRGDPIQTEAATQRATDVLGWRPQVDWRKGLLAQSEWHLTERAPARSQRRFSSAPRAHDSPRVVIYGHDTFGLGHLRRNLTIATDLVRARPDVSVMLLTGSPMAQEYAMPERVDYVKLPSVRKVANEEYQAQSVRMNATEVVQMRAAIIHETIRSFAPDLVLIDHAPAGMKGEILPALHDLRAHRPRARIVLGLRDIIDEPARVREHWAREHIYGLLDELYDEILVYGSASILDVTTAYDLPAPVAAKTRYCGYLPRERSSTDVTALRQRLCPNGERLVVVTAGGGGDGFALLHAYLGGLDVIRTARDVVSIVITGPFMEPDEQRCLRTLAARHAATQVLTFTPDALGLMQAADLVVSMGGYNTMCEVLSLGVPALVVPRTEPRREQLIRVRALARLGLLRMEHPDHLTPRQLAHHVVTLLDDPALPQQQAAAIATFAASGALDGLSATVSALSDGIDQAVALPALSLETAS